jgi:thioredoxin reductase
MRAISAIIGSILATIMVATFVTLLAPQVYTVSRMQADNVAKRLASDLNELRGSEIIYVGSAIVEVQPDKIVVSSLGLSEEEPISKTGISSAGGVVVTISSDGSSAWVGG